MKTIRTPTFLLSFLLFAVPAAADKKLPSTILVDGKTLKLNGVGKRQATDWTFFRLAENNFGWYTATASAGAGRVYLSGANLGVLEDRLWKSFTQADGS